MFGAVSAKVAVVAVAAAVLSSLAVSPAQAASAGSGTTGIDISYPQCSSSLPSTSAFVLVGVNGGLANDYNGCLTQEFNYARTATTASTSAQPKVQTYLNTADPGNGVADWPSPAYPGNYGSTTTPSGGCSFASGTSGPGANSPGCAYIYGYDMVVGINYSGGTVIGDVKAFANATGTPLYAQPVWLDVETANSWQSGSTGLAMNIAALQGMVDAIRGAANGTPVTVGIYSTSSQWNQITGTPGSTGGNLAGLANWIPGARTQSGAASNCAQSSFTGGHVALTQWTSHPYDGDYPC